MSRTLKIVLAVNLAILAVLVFVYPQFMVGPGKLIPGHVKLADDCYACHVSFAGVSSDKCASCHKPANIGKLTTTGAVITKPLTRTPFHQELASMDCAACHSDHSGVRKFRQQGHFDHALLKKDTAAQCQSCHKSPTDTLHKQISGNCSQCHTTTKWTPATFDHDKYFVLDSDHNTQCITCHVRNNYSSYTCYGCHEHTPDKIRREHVEEGIRDFSNCVKCHRSADDEGGGGD